MSSISRRPSREKQLKAHKHSQGKKKGYSIYPVTQLTSAKKPGRNKPCPCGSGIKYKNHCGEKG